MTKKNKQKIKCLFGFHNYKIPHKYTGNVGIGTVKIQLCKYCKRFGYYKYYNGREVWFEFDEKGNMIYWKNSGEHEEWCDEEGNVIHRKYSNGFEAWYEYDKEGNIIYSKYTDGFEVWYDEEGNVIKRKEGRVK